MLAIDVIDYRQLRRFYKIIRDQSGHEAPSGWSRYTFTDIACLLVALEICGGVEALQPSNRLGLLELFLRAGKSYQDHNHAAAVISYWGIIERLLHELWSDFQDDNETRDGSPFVSAERKRRLNDGRTFTAAVITEQLSFGNRLPLDLYRKLNKVRKIRNDWMHGTRNRVSGADARAAAEACQGMFKLVRSIQVAAPAGLRLHN
jgi:hypothetical protein